MGWWLQDFYYNQSVAAENYYDPRIYRGTLFRKQNLTEFYAKTPEQVFLERSLSEPVEDSFLHKILGIKGSFKAFIPPGGDSGIGLIDVESALRLAQKRSDQLGYEDITIRGIPIKEPMIVFRGMHNINPWDILKNNDGLRPRTRYLPRDQVDSDIISHTCGSPSDLIGASKDIDVAAGRFARKDGWVFGLVARPYNAIDVNLTMEKESDFEFRKQKEVALRGGTLSQDDVPWFQPYSYGRPVGYRYLNPYMSFQGWLNAWPYVFWSNVEYYATYEHTPLTFKGLTDQIYIKNCSM